MEFFAGLQVQKANPNVIEKVKEVGNLMGQADITHSYPHCWRCKKPVIFRATTQWFVSMEANELRQKALKAIRNDVEWIPSWGEERIYNMIEQRPDWCISRQRRGACRFWLLCEDLRRGMERSRMDARHCRPVRQASHRLRLLV